MFYFDLTVCRAARMQGTRVMYTDVLQHMRCQKTASSADTASWREVL